MKIRKYFSICLILLFLVSSASGSEWRKVNPADSVRMPGHLYFQKQYRVQWWYVTGHLVDLDGREFGYQLTFFTAGIQHREYESRFGVNFFYLSHFAVSDAAGKRFYHFSEMDSGAYGFAAADGDRLNVRVGDKSLKGSAGKMRLHAASGNIELDLVLVPRKPAVLHGDNGYSRKSGTDPDAASLYFSFTDLETTGTLKTGGQIFTVSGRSWFDRELFSDWPESVAGWDWFSIRLDDNREIMLYRIRNRDQSVEPQFSGTIVYRDGTSRNLDEKKFTIEVLDHYTSEHTGARYPSKWEITLPSEKLKMVVTPLIRDQEFTEARAIRNLYWEGICIVEGTVSGRAYVEMTGYDEKVRSKE